MKPYVQISECKTVAELLEDPARWQKKCYATNKQRVVCNFDSPEAAHFCLVGAMWKIYGTHSENYNKVVNVVLEKYNKWSPSLFNDDSDTTHEMVMEVVREAGI